MPTKEQVYDNQINPLMAKILKICKQHKIAMLANFRLDDDLQVTSALLAEEYEPSDGQLQALRNFEPEPAFAMAETTTEMPDGTKRITLRRIN